MLTRKKGKGILEFKLWIFFGVMSFLYVLLYNFSNQYLYTDLFYQTFFHGIADEDRIYKIVEQKQKYVVLAYFAQPAILFVKWNIISLAIFTAMLLFGHSIGYRACLKITALAELIIFFSTTIRIMSYFLLPSLSPKNFHFFFPLSIVNFFDFQKIPHYLVYPAMQINLFEVGYWWLLVFGVRYFTNKNWWASFKIIGYSYGSIFLIWNLVIMFISVQFS